MTDLLDLDSVINIKDKIVRLADISIGISDKTITNEIKAFEKHRELKGLINIEFNPFILTLSAYKTKYGLKLTEKEYKRNQILDQIKKDFSANIEIWVNEALQLCIETFTRFRNLKIIQNLPSLTDLKDNS